MTVIRSASSRRPPPAARRRSNKGDEVIVGVNRFRPEVEDRIEAPCHRQPRGARGAAEAARARAPPARPESMGSGALRRLSEVANSGEGNILEAAVEARARPCHGRRDLGCPARCLSAIIPRCRKWVHDVYVPPMATTRNTPCSSNRLAQFSQSLGAEAAPHGRQAWPGWPRPRRQGDCIGLRRHRFEIIAGPLFQTPPEAADTAIEAGVHVVGVSSLAAGHKTLLPQLVEELKARGAERHQSSSAAAWCRPPGL